VRDVWSIALLLALAGALLGWRSEAGRRRHLQRRVRAAEHAAAHDPLTGLPNRVTWSRLAPLVLAEAQAAGRPAAVLLMDLDGFKAINDGLGHAAGDEVLRVTARRLQQAAHPGVVSRLGGDEFALLLVGPAGADGAWATAAAARLRRQVTTPAIIAGHLVRIDASIGVTPATPESPSALLERADMAMYRCKRTRSGTTVGGVPSDPRSVPDLRLLPRAVGYEPRRPR
jgi:diguanylate cyclase (GGDEF)-like protein